MKEYFNLQYKITKRKLKDFGLNMPIAIILICIGFVSLSLFLFYKTVYASYIFIAISLSFTSKLSEISRNDFLKSIFSQTSYRKLRLFENILLSIPFMLFLLYKNEWFFAISIIILASLLSLIHFKNSIKVTIPTVFSKRPFEFAKGFRTSFYFFGISYFLTIMSIIVNNFNLGLFSLILTFMVCLSFYSKPEHEIYIWTFSTSSDNFLWRKIKIALLHSSILSLPIVIALLLKFHDSITIILIVQFLAYAILGNQILSKYSVYPNEIGIPESILLFLSIIFPPALLITIPYYRSKSIKKLNSILQ